MGALLRRVRWGNVGRLAALLAAGALIAGRGCAAREAEPRSRTGTAAGVTGARELREPGRVCRGASG